MFENVKYIKIIWIDMATFGTQLQVILEFLTTNWLLKTYVTALTANHARISTEY